MCFEDAIPSRTPGDVCPKDGAVYVLKHLLDDTVPDTILGKVLAGQYAIYDRIGRGGMGAVYKGLHLGLRRQVAIKTILPDPNPSRLAEHRMRFEREARILSEMRHQSIVAVYDYGEDNGILYMVLEFLDGESLYGLLRENGPLPVERAVPILKALLDALEEPHARGLIHRDIKPSNVMIERRAGRERVVLIDFGIAKVTEEDDGTPHTRTGVFVGTPKYMAPEQLGTGEMGPWTDYYALGVLLFRMLTGSTPFRGSRGEVVASQLRDAPPPLPAELDLAPFDAVISRAMEKKPEDRYPSTQAFIEHLSNAWVDWAGQLDERNSTAPMIVLTPDAIVPEAHRMTTVKRTAEVYADTASETVIQRAKTVQGPISEVSETTRTSMSGALELPRIRSGSRRGLELLLAAAAVVLAVYVGVLWMGPTPTVQQNDLRASAGREALPLPLLPSQGSLAPTAKSPSIETPPSQPIPSAGPEASASAVTKTDVTDVEATVASGGTTPTTPPNTETTAEKSGEKPETASPKSTQQATPKAKPRSTKRRTRKPRKRRASPPRKTPPEVKLAREIRSAIKACRCERAGQRVEALERLDASKAKALRSQYEMACLVTGVGCNAP